MRLKLIAAALVVAGAAFACWRWGVAETERDAARDRATALAAQVAEKDAQLSAQIEAAELRREQAARLVEVERGMQSLRQVLDAQGEAQRAGFEELKRNDQAVRDYLHRGVPRALGVRYQRPETTDPARYRRRGDLPADAVPSAGSSGDGDE